MGVAAAGAVARKVLGDGVRIRGALVQIGPHKIDRARWDWDAIEAWALRSDRSLVDVPSP